MPMLLIKCPTTKKLIPAGMVLDKGSFDKAQLTNNNTQCSACGKMHAWSKQDVAPETWRASQ